MHDWETGEVKNTYGLGDYKAKFGTVSALFCSSQRDQR